MAHGEEEEEEVGDRRKAGCTGIPTPGADAPIGPTQSGESDARNMRKHGGWFGVFISEVVEGARDQPYPLTIGMEGAIERRTKL